MIENKITWEELVKRLQAAFPEGQVEYRYDYLDCIVIKVNGQQFCFMEEDQKD